MNQKFRKEYFNELYKVEDCFWGIKAEKIVEEFLKNKKGPGKVLDLGVGEGRNAICFAKRGFNVTGVDFSEKAIRKLRSLNEKENLKIKAILSNVNRFNFQEKYDIVLALSLLHFLKEREVKRIIKKIKKHTEVSGFNLISVFTEDNPKKNFPYLFKKNQLKKFYKNWQIIHYKEFFTSPQKHGKGPVHRHAIALVIAKRIN
ncbi:MAG: methyltransferase domain-containing protein [Candidatus Nealsonbacteria bacterium]